MNSIILPLSAGLLGILVYVIIYCVRNMKLDLTEAIKILLSLAGATGAMRLGARILLEIPVAKDITETDHVMIVVGSLAVIWVSAQTVLVVIATAFRKKL